MNTNKVSIESKLWSAICFKKYDKAKKILNENNINPDYVASGKGIMHLIAKTSEIDIAKMLLDKGANINLLDGWGKIPLITALVEYEQRDFEDDSMIRFLIKHGAGRDSNNKLYENVANEFKRIKQVLKVIEPEKLEKLDWLNV